MMTPEHFEGELRASLERHFIRTPWPQVNEQTPPNLAEAIRYSLMAPGKRIRPRLALACAQMLGLSDPAVLPAAIAIEMIHCFTLIHDDLPCMDNDDFRRGRPSNHKVHGEALALLAGDALMALAIDAFLDAKDHVPATNLLSGLQRLSHAMGARGVIGGQAAESLLTRNSKMDEMSRMHAQKTGALFVASLLTPKDLAGIPDDTAQGQALDTFARELGLAFQIADDLEDATDASPEPTSVLNYMSAAEAQELTSRRLRKATDGLTAQWKDAAAPLVRIAEEVDRKLLAPLATSKT